MCANYIEYRCSFAFASSSFSVSPRCAAGIFASTRPTTCVAAPIFCAWIAWWTNSAARRTFNFESPLSSGAISSISSLSLRDSSNRPVFANDFAARSSIAKRWTVPGSRGMEYDKVRAWLMIFHGGLVARHLGLDLVRPLVDSAGEVLHLAEAKVPQEVRDAAGANAGLAVHDDFVGRAELVHAGGHLGHRHEDRLVQPRNLPFHRLADVQEHDRLALVDLLLQLPDRNLKLLADLLRRPSQATELFVVDEFLDRRIRAANRTLGVLP